MMIFSKEERRIQEEKEVIEELGEIKGLKKLNKADMADKNVGFWSATIFFALFSYNRLSIDIASIRRGTDINMTFFYIKIIIVVVVFISLVGYFIRMNRIVKERVKAREERIKRLEKQEKYEALYWE
jgi:hypothetical protein